MHSVMGQLLSVSRSFCCCSCLFLLLLLLLLLLLVCWFLEPWGYEDRADTLYYGSVCCLIYRPQAATGSRIHNVWSGSRIKGQKGRYKRPETFKHHCLLLLLFPPTFGFNASAKYAHRSPTPTLSSLLQLSCSLSLSHSLLLSCFSCAVPLFDCEACSAN